MGEFSTRSCWMVQTTEGLYPVMDEVGEDNDD